MSFEGDKVNKNQIESKYGVLIVNLGTPDKFNYWPVRRFLNQFLLDNRVVEIPKLIWWPILQLVLLLSCLLYTSPSPRDSRKSRMPSSA